MADDQQLMQIADQLRLIAQALNTQNQILIDLKGGLERIEAKTPRKPPGNI
jgi:hypothetical protein